MSKLAFAVAALALAGCASTGQWRGLTIDSSNEQAFFQSVLALHEELPGPRQRLFEIALRDIARTGVLQAGEADDGSAAYTDQDFRSELDGLGYAGVVALADQTGVPVWRQSTYARQTLDGSEAAAAERLNRPVFDAGGRPIRDSRPGGSNWPLGADANGRAIYPEQ